jgi:phospholipid/cholesterol/gamma-HCH transport system substrate-binding protein
MAQKRVYFLVGLFVTVGILMAAAAIVWLGATKYFQKGSFYATYFDESVQGLQVDSIVKFRGVDIGSVRRIGVAPDQRLIEVVMKIDAKNFSVGGVVASLRLAGITGIVYVELDTKKEDAPTLVPKDFAADYPVIPSAPSGIKQIESSINDILGSIKEINFKGIGDQVMRTAKSIDDLVNGQKLKRIMADAEKTASNLAAASDKLNRSLNDGSMDELLADVRGAVKDARELVARMKSEIEGMKMAQTTGKINRFVDGTSRKVHSVLTEVELTSETLRRTAESLEGFIERLNQDPSALIFSSPPKGD